MPFIATNYLQNAKAPMGSWVCTRAVSLGPFNETPTADKQRGPNFCGQCVSFVTTVCPTIPVNTGEWKKGEQVKGSNTILPGTAIATFDSNGKYFGHAAIYENQNTAGINVVDQWVTPPATPIHKRLLRFGARGNSNNGDNFFVIE